MVLSQQRHLEARKLNREKQARNRARETPFCMCTLTLAADCVSGLIIVSSSALALAPTGELPNWHNQCRTIMLRKAQVGH